MSDINCENVSSIKRQFLVWDV